MAVEPCPLNDGVTGPSGVPHHATGGFKGRIRHRTHHGHGHSHGHTASHHNPHGHINAHVAQPDTGACHGHLKMAPHSGAPTAGAPDPGAHGLLPSDPGAAITAPKGAALTGAGAKMAAAVAAAVAAAGLAAASSGSPTDPGSFGSSGPQTNGNIPPHIYAPGGAGPGHTGSGPALGRGTSVPEPSTVMTFLLAATLVLALRQFRRAPARRSAVPQRRVKQ